MRQNLKYIRIFGSKISEHIPSKKYFKSDIQKTWNSIFIGYIDTTKHLRVWTLKTHQVFITNELIVNKLKSEAKLLLKYQMLKSEKLF